MIINSKMTRNRAEEYGFDLWTDFVIPPYFQSLKTLKSEKPLIIEGGRGSGKTMLLRYLCHATQFSTQRKNVEDSVFEHIGIYWKMDVSFASLMEARGADQELWKSAFENMAVLVLCREVLESLGNMTQARPDVGQIIDKLDLSELRDIDAEIPLELPLLKRYLRKKDNQFQVWVNNYKKLDTPLFYPMRFLEVLIENLVAQIPLLKNSFFSIYIDEYENLNVSQKKIVNTWLKQCHSPLVFNIAMKRQSFDVADTLGSEKIVAVHDYRKIDIESLLNDHFETFASEIFLLKVNEYLCNFFKEEDRLKKEDRLQLYDSSEISLNIRQSRPYRDSVKQKIERIFPNITASEVASEIFADEKLFDRLKRMIKTDLRELNKESYFAKIFALKVDPAAIIVLHALLNRRTLIFEDVYKELVKYSMNERSKFKEWISTNLFGCLLNFYGKLNRICPLYSGYSTFVTMSNGNIRHFLELCYTSLSISDEDGWRKAQRVERNEQLQAVKYVSNNMINEIKKFGSQGNVLYQFSLRLGTIFEELRKKDSQSEPEQNQFSIKGQLPVDGEKILRELVKWSVVFESKLTKQKGLESGSEYMFNPIYSAYFTISYRKKRRIEFTVEEFMALISEDEKRFEMVLRRFVSKTSLCVKSVELSIFD